MILFYWEILEELAAHSNSASWRLTDLVFLSSALSVLKFAIVRLHILFFCYVLLTNSCVISLLGLENRDG